MNKKRVISLTKRIVSGVLLGGLIFGAGSCLASDVSKLEVPEVIDINIQKSCPDLEGLKKDVKEVKGFTHKAHIGYLQKEQKDKFVCASCHKGVKDEKEIINSKKCERLSKEFEEVGGAKNFKKYFHNSCVKCHKNRKKEGLSTGPTSCKDCHNRKGGE